MALTFSLLFWIVVIFLTKYIKCPEISVIKILANSGISYSEMMGMTNETCGSSDADSHRSLNADLPFNTYCVAAIFLDIGPLYCKFYGESNWYTKQPIFPLDYTISYNFGNFPMIILKAGNVAAAIYHPSNDGPYFYYREDYTIAITEADLEANLGIFSLAGFLKVSYSVTSSTPCTSYTDTWNYQPCAVVVNAFYVTTTSVSTVIPDQTTTTTSPTTTLPETSTSLLSTKQETTTTVVVTTEKSSTTISTTFETSTVSTISIATTSAGEMCPCSCDFQAKIDFWIEYFQNNTFEDLLREAIIERDAIIRSLTLNLTTLTSYKIRKHSAPDERQSAQSIGGMGIVVLVCCAALIVFCDAVEARKHCKVCFKKNKKKV